MRGLAAVTTLLMLAALPARAAGSGNHTQDYLLGLSGKARAAHFAREVGHGCVGKSTFFMGMTTTGAARGYVYWSLLCRDGASWAIQIAPDADGKSAAVQCEALKALGNGRECFKRF